MLPVLRLSTLGRLAPVILVSLSLAACSGSNAAGTKADPASGRGGQAADAGRGGRGGRGAGGPVAVSVAKAVEKAMPINVQAVGNVEATSTVEVRAQVAGQLQSVDFKEGQDVTKGQLLFTIDPQPFEVAVRQAEATLARDNAQLQGTQEQVTRSNDLFKRGLVAKSDNDAINTTAAAQKAVVAADSAAVDNAKLQLAYTRIIAPVSGRTGALLVHPGSLVRANDTNPLLVINQIAPAYVSFSLPARLLPQLRASRGGAGLKVEAAPANSEASASTGTVSFVDNAVDAASDTIRLKATFPNRDRQLWPGAFVNVTLELSVDPHAIVVPNAAVQPSQQGQFIFVVKPDQTVESRPVAVAWTDGDSTVIQHGIQAGETVVTDGQLRLTPGARVSIKAPAQPKVEP
jgi:multidrug efflux system membrane fusion protein